MAHYKLDITFTAEQLQQLHTAKRQVVIARRGAGIGPDIAWQVFRPECHNTLSWTDRYGIYVSDVHICNGAGLVPISREPGNAAIHKLHILDKHAVIRLPGTDGLPGAFALLHTYRDGKRCLTAGLYQDAFVNGTEIAGNAVSATPVLYQNTAVMHPPDTVCIWLQADMSDNTVVAQPEEPVTLLQFTQGQATAAVRYDSRSGKFIPVADHGYKAGNVPESEAV